MIRSAVESDLERIVAIYNESIPERMATADTEPVSAESRLAWFRDRDPGHPIWVLERNRHVVAWLSFSPFYGRPAYAATAELSVYVDPVARRTGAAAELVGKAIHEAPGMAITTLLAFVFAHNHASLALCRKFGFEPWGELPGVALLDGFERDLLILGRRVGGRRVETHRGKARPGPAGRGQTDRAPLSRSPMAIWIRALLALLALPGLLAFGIPILLLRPESPLRIAGAIPLAFGSALLLWCVRDFLVVGRGTLAPWDPPRTLVEVGAYRFSRNPMYVAVGIIMLGWALAYRSVPILLYALLLILAFHLRVVWVEEPRLERAFGDAWRRYAARVPRWFWRR